METKLVVFFKKEIKELVDAKYDRISAEIQKHTITRLSSANELDLIKASVLQSLWRWPQIAIDINSSRAETTDLRMSVNEAQMFLEGGFSFSGSTMNVLRIAYRIDFQGSPDALTYSNFGDFAIQFFGNISHDHFEIHYFTELPPSEELAGHYKAKKGQILNQINEAIQNNLNYLKTEQLAFQKAIGEHVDNALIKVKEKADRDNLFSS